MTNVGYIQQQKGPFYKHLEQEEYCIMANQLGGSALNFSEELHCEQCKRLMALICQYSTNIKNRVRTVYCFGCKRDCGEISVMRVFREHYKATISQEYHGLESVCCVKRDCRNPKNNMKMYKRNEILMDEEEEFDDGDYGFDSMGLLMYQQDFPTTVLRWTNNKELAFITDENVKISFKNCDCGSKRVLECQILPNSLYFLKQKEEINTLDFGTLLIGCCEKNCGANDEVIQDQAIRMTFKDPPKNDDGVYDYSYLLNRKQEE